MICMVSRLHVHTLIGSKFEVSLSPALESASDKGGMESVYNILILGFDHLK